MEDNISLRFVFMGIMIKGIHSTHPSSPQMLIYTLHVRKKLWVISPTGYNKEQINKLCFCFLSLKDLIK